MADLDALIEKLEAAPEGSRELDGEVGAFVGGAVWKGPAGSTLRNPTEPELQKQHEALGQGEWVYPKYSRSIDAALTLVPEGWYTIHAGQNAATGKWFWGLGINAGVGGRTLYENVNLAPWIEGRPTPALALTIAALKARRSQDLEADDG